ncbi:MAG: hypothetical protein K6F82_05510 [Sphaerochaetaceae bacterium]|nr:hypothetical protein [Sphaerochaetaceae bacterium]
MIKKSFIVFILLLSIMTPVFADGFEYSLGSTFSLSGTKVFDVDGINDHASAEGYAEATYSIDSLKADVKGVLTLHSEEKAEYDFEKLSVCYTMMGLQNNNLTITAGKFPSDWGLGYVDAYKVSDSITPDDNEYSVAAAQDLNDLWHVELQAVLPIANDETFKIGAQGRKGFSMDVLKEARAALVLNPTDNLVTLSAAANLKYWADFTVGTDFTYFYDEDADIKTKTVLAASALKNFVFSTETDNKTLIDALALRFTFNGSDFASTEVINNAALDLTKKVQIISSTEFIFSKSSTKYSLTAGASYALADGLKADGYLNLTNKSGSSAVSLTAVLSYEY